jgi:flagellar motor switch protein FliG
VEKDIKRGITAYKNSNSSGSDSGNDWLARLAENDFGVTDSAGGIIEERPKAEPLRRFEKQLKQEPAGKTPPPAVNESKARRVAKFLILIGSEQASKVLENLDGEQIEAVSREIASIRGISTGEAASILAEFDGLLSGAYHYSGSNSGGVDEARKLLYAAFGPEKGELILRRATNDNGAGVFDFLEDFSGEQIMTLLRDESPAAGAVILSRIEPQASAAALKCADEAWRSEVVRRIGRLGRIAPEVLEKTAESLREKARHIGKTSTSELDGMGALAAILKHTDISFGDKLLSELAETDADLSKNIKERLYTLEDVIKAEDKPLQEKLREMSIHDIALLTRGRPAEFTEKILSNISANRRAEVRAEDEYMGPVLKKDAEAAIKEFMEWFRKAREEGSILMLGDELVE